MAVSLTALGGCEVFEPAPPPRLDIARTAYQSGQFAQAYEISRAVARRNDAPDRYDAAYLAGLSAQRLGDMSNAVRYLRLATGSEDRGLRGQALATLGLAYARQSKHAAAADALLKAAKLVTGQDRAQAYFHAGIAEQKLGRWAQARTSLTLARGASNDPTFQRLVTEQLDVTGYTLQTGAFENAGNARKHAENLAKVSVGLNLGSPRVVPATDPQGRRLNLVQVGQFATFANAASARRSLGRSDAVIVPLTQ